MKEALSNKPLVGGVIILCTAIILSFGLKTAGYHLERGRLVRGGDILVSSLPADARIFLDNRRVYPDTKTPDFVKNIAPGDHSILIFNEQDWPWLKNIAIRPATTTTIAPFLISKNPSGDIIAESDDRYETLVNEIRALSLPTVASPLVSKSGNVSVWVDGNTVMAAWKGASSVPPFFCDVDGTCPATMEVTKSQAAIRNIDFYKDRDDVLLIASQNGVFAIELDRRGGTQNFQPIYKGAGLPRFKVMDEHTIYVLDGSILLTIGL